MFPELGQTHADRRLAQIEVIRRLRYASGSIQLGNHCQQLQIDVGHVENTPDAGAPLDPSKHITGMHAFVNSQRDP